MPNNPVHHSSFNDYHSGLIPVYYWQGVRPVLFDLPADHTGWLVCLALQREGNLCFLPLAWDRQQQTDDDNRSQLTPLPPPSWHTQAQQQQYIDPVITQLQNDGWQVNGRFTIYFTGSDTDPDFISNTDNYLWQTPGEFHGD